jgi:hypothetical protein
VNAECVNARGCLNTILFLEFDNSITSDCLIDACWWHKSCIQKLTGGTKTLWASQLFDCHFRISIPDLETEKCYELLWPIFIAQSFKRIDSDRLYPQ